MQSIQEKLKQIGLSGNEAKIYLELLKRGSVNGSTLAKKAGLDRTLTYQVLNNLVEKGLANYLIKEHKKYFSVTNPENLLRVVKEQEYLIQNLIPELKKIKTLEEIEQLMEIYEGISGLKVLYEEILNTKELCFFGATGKSYDVLQWGMERIKKEFMKRGIKSRGIASTEVKGMKWTKLKNLKMKYVLGGESKNTNFGILDRKKIAIVCLEQEKPIVILIRNQFMAQTLQNYFEFMWESAE